MVKFLLIGNGFIAPRHKEAIKKINGQIAGIIDIKDEWKEAIKKTDANCVVILTPNDLHFEMSKYAAKSGKIVICEKPLAIKTKDAEELAHYKNIFTVLQLRYHLDVEKIKSEAILPYNNEIEIDISVYRDDNYFNGWKGKIERSGGVLFNLGVHYFDLLIYLFGEPEKAVLESLDDKTGKGYLEAKSYKCRFNISVGEKQENQKRVFRINGKQYNFSSQDNLSYENLHQFVYKDMLEGKGVLPEESLKSIKVIENLYKTYGNIHS